jgi:hypothetical protein
LIESGRLRTGLRSAALREFTRQRLANYCDTVANPPTPRLASDFLDPLHVVQIARRRLTNWLDTVEPIQGERDRLAVTA